MFSLNKVYVLVAVLFVIFFIVYIKKQTVPVDASFTGSLKCQSCHMNEHASWDSGLHPKMMRKVSQAGVVIADFHNDEIAFDSSQAVWSIGGKWEQQFMGEQAGAETLLPGAWLVGQQKWNNTGWDGWQVPDPLQRCHGCHTVGLNVETGKFVEPSIGCESCHGKGSWHVNTAGLGKIFISIDAQVCGQCHTRGRSTDGKYFFAEGYQPGLKLADYFKEDEPDYIQNSNKWWANGHPRKRHQEYYSWSKDGHVNSLKSLKENYDDRYGAVTSKCLPCHAGEAIMDGQSEEYQLEQVRYGITCVACHNSHGDLDKPRLTCSNCHGDGASYHQPEKNSKHIACTPEANVGCVGCHMPKTVMNGGDYTLHSHKAGIIRPTETRDIGVPNSCANGGCHADKSIDWLEAAFDKHYGI